MTNRDEVEAIRTRMEQVGREAPLYAQLCVDVRTLLAVLDVRDQEVQRERDIWDALLAEMRAAADGGTWYARESRIVELMGRLAQRSGDDAGE